MIRLERGDFDEPEQLAEIAAAAEQSPEQFRSRLGYLVGLGT